MRINALKKEIIEVEITEEQIKEICLTKINTLCHYPSNEWFIEDGYICVEEEFHTSHKWFETKKIRLATPFDEQVYLLKKLIISNEKLPLVLDEKLSKKKKG